MWQFIRDFLVRVGFMIGLAILFIAVVFGRFFAD
jgi:hypothetical protein